MLLRIMILLGLSLCASESVFASATLEEPAAAAAAEFTLWTPEKLAEQTTRARLAAEKMLEDREVSCWNDDLEAVLRELLAIRGELGTLKRELDKLNGHCAASSSCGVVANVRQDVVKISRTLQERIAAIAPKVTWSDKKFGETLNAAMTEAHNLNQVIGLIKATPKAAAFIEKIMAIKAIADTLMPLTIEFNTIIANNIATDSRVVTARHHEVGTQLATARQNIQAMLIALEPGRLNTGELEDPTAYSIVFSYGI
ncbi:MAG: hypothetical protein QG604_507 [Candidatus Dependentiae bacterium]|nr:hypothetical protein [Candidatus Dependentiae bacterium]